MTRQRKFAGNTTNENVYASKLDSGTGNSSSSNGSNSNKQAKKKSILSHWMTILGSVGLAVAATVSYVGYLETRVNTPFDDNKMVLHKGLEVQDRYWGTYRPLTYFGLKTRDPNSLVTGLMWYFPSRLTPGGQGFRHWCEQGDGLKRYGWLQHDGKDFGIQEIEDGPFLLTTSFVKRSGGEYGGDWTARISVIAKDPSAKHEEAALIWYTATDEKTGGFIEASRVKDFITGVRGQTPGLGHFDIKMFNFTGVIKEESFLSTSTPGLHKITETVISSLRLAPKSPTRKSIVLAGDLLANSMDDVEPNLIATHLTVSLPFTMDVVFESQSNMYRPEMLKGDIYTEKLERHSMKFSNRFENTFHLTEKGRSKEEVKFAQACFSNLVGGVGYFYGASRVQSEYTKEPVPYWKAPLYTAVPSRSFFPRGFLWDEGFHGFLIAAWDLDMELDIINHWFDLMNVEGWIPREQILGLEALSKVPEEFVTQRNTNANPPTFFLTLRFILQNYPNQLLTEPLRLKNFERLYPRLQAWFSWFNTTQRGNVPGSYRWRGRDSNAVRELNPKTLTSGLDDYPRATHPTEDERHIDLRCWIALAASVLDDIGKLLNRDTDKYADTYDYLSNNQLLDQLHWSPNTETYADYGLHTDNVVLKRPKPQRPTPGQSLEKIRYTLKNPELRFVDNSFGYVSLFPFLLQILDPNSPKLGKILVDLNKPELLWTSYGLRSLAKNSPFYMKYNTEHDPPYWRGPIWMNINYLTLKALHYYGSVDGSFKDQAKDLELRLKDNLIRNVMGRYNSSGYVWENYNDRTGEGKGSHPFTGWSSLIVLIMGDYY